MKKKELARLREAVEYVADLHDDVMMHVNELRDALTRANEEVKAARVALEAAEGREAALSRSVPIAS